MTECYIYGHYCRVSQKWYIGQTLREPSIRFGNNGCNYINNNQKKFENAIKKYGWENFDHVILEICDISMADEREIYWISEKDSYINGYNSTLGGNRLYDSCKKPVVKIDPKDGTVIDIYDSAVDAAFDNNLYNGSMINACCNKNALTAAGYCWSYLSELDDFTLPVFPKRMYYHRIAKLDPITMEILDVYDSAAIAGKENNIPNLHKNSCRITKNPNVKIGGFCWKFLERRKVVFI